MRSQRALVGAWSLRQPRPWPSRGLGMGGLFAEALRWGGREGGVAALTSPPRVSLRALGGVQVRPWVQVGLRKSLKVKAGKWASFGT